MGRCAMMLGFVGAVLLIACGTETMDRPGGDDVPVDQPPVAVDDMLTTIANRPGSIDVLANDHDPNGDRLSVTTFARGAHGTVAVAGAVATYTPAVDYVGADSFTYTLSDGHLTATGTVSVVVLSSTPGCTITASGPATGTFGDVLHLTATAACSTGAAQVQWYHKVNSAFAVVQPFSTTTTLDFTADAVGDNVFYAVARTQGTTAPQATSNLVTIKTADNTPQCTSVKMVAPANGQAISVNVPQTLTASATCPAGSVPEYQFWVKPTTATTWQVLPGYTTGSSSWTPPSAGSWSVRAVARTVGSHVSYQVGSMSVTVGVS